MAMNPFPPQAYTRETLVQAYQWLQSQNPQVRELANTPDLLVSLFMKSQNHKGDIFDRPSLQTFKSELKSLAGMMGEFEIAPAAEALTEASLAEMPAPAAQKILNHGSSSSRPSQTQNLASAQKVSSVKLELDPLSLQMIHEVKNRFNLSSDQEALRLLVSIGYQKTIKWVQG